MSCDIIEDIEDIVSKNDVTPKERQSSKHFVKIRARKLNEGESVSQLVGITGDELQSFVPGTQKIYIKTWGCTHNSSDSEYMAGQLSSYGYQLTDEKENADLWLLNSCTVKTPAEDHFRNEIQAAKRSGKSVVLAGCVPQGAPDTQFCKGLSVIGVQQIDRVVEVVEETLKGNTVRLLKSKREKGKGRLGGASLDLPKVRRNTLVEIIPINTGCLNQCTYCKTKHARGQLGSYPPEEIVARAQQCFEEGVRELWLTSEDTGAYGRDIGANLPDLLHSLTKIIPEGCMMRVGMTNPPYILEHLKEMAKILSHPRVYSFLHIPVQSGSDSVLADMKREYCRADFEEVVDFLKERVPGVTIATDIICGFPTETDSDFDETMSLCEKYKFPSLFINQFFPRPGTPAARMPRIPPVEVKKRTKRLSEFFQSYQPYSHRLNEVQDVLVTEVSYSGQHYVGHNKFYEQVLVPKLPDLMGKMVTVKIVETQKHCLIGNPIRVKNSNENTSITLSKKNFTPVENGLNYTQILKSKASKFSFVSSKPSLMSYSLFVFMIAFFVRLLWIFWV